MRLTLTFLFLFCSQILVGQITASQLIANSNFQWAVDSSSQKIIIYYGVDSWTAKNIEKVSQRVFSHFNAVESFMGITSYPAKINYFIVESREQMKALIGRETNGAAFYENNVITGIASADMNSIYSNHEMFHVVAMNIWGVVCQMSG